MMCMGSRECKEAGNGEESDVKNYREDVCAKSSIVGMLTKQLREKKVIQVI